MMIVAYLGCFFGLFGGIYCFRSATEEYAVRWLLLGLVLWAEGGVSCWILVKEFIRWVL